MQKALFLDRDGIINRDDGYVYLESQLVWMPGIFELCRAARAAGYRLIVVTNQSGIGRGYFSEEDYLRLQAFIHRRFKEEGAPLTHTYYCGDAPKTLPDGTTEFSLRRKPNPGMFLEAFAEHGIDPSASIMLGDSERDMLAARSAGIPTRLLLRIEGTDLGIDGSHTHIIQHLISAANFLL